MRIVQVISKDLNPLDLNVLSLPLLTSSFGKMLEARLHRVALDIDFPGDLWPADDVVAKLERGIMLREEELYEGGLRVRYPWDLLRLNDILAGSLGESQILGQCHPSAVLEGNIMIGENTRILPGVIIEGNVIIGNNCKIGPNCYILGNTAIGDNCRICHAAEIKNSLLAPQVRVDPLCYIGDSVIDRNSSIGAGTVTANTRHDGASGNYMVRGKLIDTGRSKFGAIIGSCVHTGVNTTIYPGRKLYPGVNTRPGEAVVRDM